MLLWLRDMNTQMLRRRVGVPDAIQDYTEAAWQIQRSPQAVAHSEKNATDRPQAWLYHSDRESFHSGGTVPLFSTDPLSSFLDS